ncbi:hypothetical protein AB0952_04840 [Streptomyces caniferus]|uniref:hypothetical protein n=1 Tax=Streptomyces caniferus TaxID=285557 RepID=UPI0034526E79
MGDIAKGVLGGAWTLLVGWILPTALNLALFFVTVAPGLQGLTLLHRLRPTTGGGSALLFLTGSLLLGLVANAFQNPLYRLLEGYLFWPAAAYEAGCRRSRRAKADLTDRRSLLRLERREREDGELSRRTANCWPAFGGSPAPSVPCAGTGDAPPHNGRWCTNGSPGTPWQTTRSRPPGSATPRFEEYGYDRYRLDAQVLWNELTGCVPDQVRRQVSLARTSVDFFVALLYGHVVVCFLAVLTLATARPDTSMLWGTIVLLLLLVPVWYRSAVTSTDEWAAAVRAMVNVGRKPLADAMCLVLPDQLAMERDMWTMVSGCPGFLTTSGRRLWTAIGTRGLSPGPHNGPGWGPGGRVRRFRAGFSSCSGRCDSHFVDAGRTRRWRVRLPAAFAPSPYFLGDAK